MKRAEVGRRDGIHAVFCGHARLFAAARYAVLFCALGASHVHAQEQLLFPSRDNVASAIVARINAETVRIDVATWYLTVREITDALISRHNAGVRVRVIGDRVSIFEIDAFTRREFGHLASNGVPVRLRYNPTSFPSIMHWKAGIFVGQGVVEFGSANWTPFELVPWSPTNFKDETALFTSDGSIVSAFKSRFDQFWADTTNFVDWPRAYELETGQPWTRPMAINRTRLEPTIAGPSTIVWEQGPVLNNRMVAEIGAETQSIEMVVYRLSNTAITNALIARRRAGVPVRLMVEPSQYRESTWPEYWLTGARVDQLWAAGAQIKERVHEGLTHMKVLITSRSAMNGSSNFTGNWQRDHNYFIPATTKPALHGALRGEFNRMWNDAANYRDFYPKPPATPALASPLDMAVNVSRTPQLQWHRTPWAVAFDVYLGTSPFNLTFQGRVNAVLTESPPAAYSWTPSVALQPGTQYFWQIVARTVATDVDPSLVAPSVANSFVTTGAAPGGVVPGSSALRRGLMDFDGDGKSDPTVYRRSVGTWFALRSGAQFGSWLTHKWGVSTDLPVPGDYDGDGRTDFAVYRPSNGHWCVLLSRTGYTDWIVYAWGVSTDVPVPADYDGDGRTDIAVWRPGDGVWYVRTSASGYASQFAIQWGAPGDHPLPRDYDGDGRADITVWRPGGGMWFIRKSSTGYTAFESHQWGAGVLGDVPVPGDYDGDGRAEIAVWRPGIGVWFVRTSRSAYRSSFTVQWGAGIHGDVPVPGDYDGDGRLDITVWRPGDGVWHVKTSTTSYSQYFSRQWGARSLGDIPIR